MDVFCKIPRFGEGCPSSLVVWCQLNGHAKFGSPVGLHLGAPFRRGPGETGDRGRPETGGDQWVGDGRSRIVGEILSLGLGDYGLNL